MKWEFWTTQLDEEVLVEEGEFGTQEGELVELLGFSFRRLIKSALCSQVVINEKLVLNVVSI